MLISVASHQAQGGHCFLEKRALASYASTSTHILKPDVNRFHQGFQNLDINPSALYQELEISTDAMQSEGFCLPMESFFALLNRGAEITGRRFFGIDITLSLDNAEMGVLAYMLKCAPNFELSLDLLHRYVALVSPGSDTSLREFPDHYVLTYRHKTFAPALCYQDIEATLAQFVMMIRDLLGDDSWQPPVIYLEHPQLASDDAAQFPFGEKVIFGHAYSGICFPKEILQHPIGTSDPNLLKILESQVLQHSRDLVTQDSFIDRIRLLIAAGIGKPELTSDQVASAVGMSRRTLNRRLKEHGATYNSLRETAVIDLATRALINTSTSITEIAQSLGYSDSSAFNRLFKRVAGQAPRQYRKHNQPS